MNTLVELCAGTASVSLWALARLGPLTGYMGSKRRWAPLLVEALGVDRPDRVVLVDAGPWGDVWTVLRRRHLRDGVSSLLDVWGEREDVAWLWNDLVHTPPGDHPVYRVAQFLWLQARAAGTIPIWWSTEHGRWRSPTGAVDPTRDMDLAARTKGRVGRPASKGSAASVGGRRGWGSGRRTAGLIAARVRALDALPWDRIVVVHGDVRTVPPEPATVYIDPPYVGCPRYAAMLSRAELLTLTERWADAGARVAVSEAEPLPIPGWTPGRLPSVKPEWVTASWAIRLPEQLDLWSAA